MVSGAFSMRLQGSKLGVCGESQISLCVPAKTEEHLKILNAFYLSAKLLSMLKMFIAVDSKYIQIYNEIKICLKYNVHCGKRIGNGIISPKLGTEISLKYMKIDIVVGILQWILGTDSLIRPTIW